MARFIKLSRDAIISTLNFSRWLIIIKNMWVDVGVIVAQKEMWHFSPWHTESFTLRLAHFHVYDLTSISHVLSHIQCTTTDSADYLSSRSFLSWPTSFSFHLVLLPFHYYSVASICLIRVVWLAVSCESLNNNFTAMPHHFRCSVVE